MFGIKRAVLLLVGLLCLGICSQSANATPGTLVWSREMPAITPTQVSVAADGSIVSAGCGENGIVGADATGYFNNVFSASSDTASYRHCPHDSVVGNDGTVYNKSQFAPSADTSVPGIMLVRATKNGANKWVYTLGSTSCADRYYDVQWLTLGADGDVYFVAVPGYGCSRDSSFLVGLNANNGSLKFRQALDSNLNFTTISQFIGVMSMFAYDDGLVVLDGATLRYFDYDGDEVTSKAYTISMPAGVDIVRMYGGSDDGSVVVEYLNNTDDTYHDHTCYNKVEKVLHRSGDNSTPTTISLGAPCRAYKTKLMPNGKILVTWSDSGVYYFRVIDSAGTEVATNQYLARSTLFPDVNGNLLGFGKTTRRFTLQLFDGSGALVRDYDSDWLTPPGNTPDNRTANTRVGMSDGYVFVTSCAGVCSSSTTAKLYKVSLPGVGMDYPRGTLLGTSTPDTRLKYVALGDSYSSGEGVPPFTGASDTATNRCHRSEKAYPFLLEQDTSLDLNLSAFVACSGAKTDNVRNSGQYTEPEQIRALNEGTDIVTITIGGNDIKFARTAITCNSSALVRDCEDALQESLDIANSSAFTSDVQATLRAVRDQAPNARILVLGYPYIFMYPNTAAAHCGWWSRLMSPNEEDLLAEITEQLNYVISADSLLQPLRAEFVDVKDIFQMHEVCRDERFFHPVDFTKPREYTYHPNEQGQNAYKEAIAEYLNN